MLTHLNTTSVIVILSESQIVECAGMHLNTASVIVIPFLAMFITRVNVDLNTASVIVIRQYITRGVCAGVI